MAFVTPTTALTGDLIAATDWNQNTVDNPIALRTGAIAIASQAVGDLVIATSATQLGRVADVATGQVLVSGGVATAPAYSASPSITALTYTTSVKSTTALATPGALSATQATAFASTVSGAAIMGFGTTNDVSLMNRAGTVVLGVGPNTTTVNMTGLLTVSGFGTHTFSSGGTGANALHLVNTTAGTGNLVRFRLDTDVTENLVLRGLSSTYTTSGPYVASGGSVEGAGAGGLSIAATHASGVIRFYSGGTTLSAGFPNPNMFFVGTSATYPTGSTNTVYIDNVSNVNTAFSHGTTGNQSWIVFMNSNGQIGSITGSGSTTAFNTTSDRRLKLDQGLVTDVEALRRVQVHEFQWLVDGRVDRGVFAQETADVYPRAVSVGTDELSTRGLLKHPWQVDYSRFVPDLIVGWQQHDATIQSLTARIAALESGA